jgi:prepilin-type N-terminal cleavage/methylation domain-containing protein
MQKNKAFTLIELLVVISIISVLAAISLTAFSSAKDKVYLGRAKAEFRSVETALELYRMDNNDQYPGDAMRDVAPTGLSQYLGGYGTAGWPKAPWPNSSFDWDYWPNGGNPIYQISVRFCPQGGALSECNFPKAGWADSFGVNSAVYYCVSGPCRAHESELPTYPGYCVNCP